MTTEEKARAELVAGTLVVLRENAEAWQATANRHKGALLGERLIVLDVHERAYSQLVDGGETTFKLKMPDPDLNGVLFMTRNDADLVKADMDAKVPQSGPFVVLDFQEYAQSQANASNNLVQKLAATLELSDRIEDSVVPGNDGAQTALDRKMAPYFEKFKLEKELAKEKGLEINPSVNGAYLFNPATQQVVGLRGSDEYEKALYRNLETDAKDSTKAEPSPTLLAAVEAYRLKHGAKWKEKLSDAWASGRDDREPDGHLLRQVRNNFGPEWLQAYRPGKVETVSVTSADVTKALDYLYGANFKESLDDYAKRWLDNYAKRYAKQDFENAESGGALRQEIADQLNWIETIHSQTGLHFGQILDFNDSLQELSAKHYKLCEIDVINSGLTTEQKSVLSSIEVKISDLVEDFSGIESAVFMHDPRETTTATTVSLRFESGVQNSFLGGGSYKFPVHPVYVKALADVPFWDAYVGNEKRQLVVGLDQLEAQKAEYALSNSEEVIEEPEAPAP